jgi:precorrin-6Y C5,15-methyltransferase (decarboxylating)
VGRNIFVIGIDGTGALSEKAVKALSKGVVVLTSERVNLVFSKYPQYETVREKIKIINKIEDTISFLKEASGPVPVLASGDPLFFGIATKILKEFPPEEVEIIPAISSIQFAFSAIKEPWEDAYFISLHGDKTREWGLEDLPLLCELHPKLVIFTGGENTPSKIMEYLPEGSHIHLMERLGHPDEKITEGTRTLFLNGVFSEPNLIIVNPPLKETPFAFGLNEADFAHDKGLITKDEVRAVALHKLTLPRKGVLWDIGAGSGSVSIEAKRIAPGLDVYAIEKGPLRVKNIKTNIRNLRGGRITVIEGKAPEVLAGLPAPARVFIGGGGESLSSIIGSVSRAMERGILVIAVVTLETLEQALSSLRENGFKTKICSVSIARGEPVGERHYMKALNTVFLLKGTK